MALLRGSSRLDENGKMVIPSHIRRRVGLRPDQLVEMRVTGSNEAPCVVIHNRQRHRRRRQQAMRGSKRQGGLKDMERRVRGLADIKINQKIKLHSMPLRKTSRYLQFYALGMEKHRLQQYKRIIDETKRRTDNTLEEIERERGEIALAVAEEEVGERKIRERAPKASRSVKTMTLEY